MLKNYTEKFILVLHWATIIIEVLVALAMVALAGGALFKLMTEVVHLATSGVDLTPAVYNGIIGTILEIFILLELFRIAIAYMRHRHVVPVVLEAALVAVARKFVVFEGGTQYLQTAAGLAALLVAVALSWWMLSRASALEDVEE